MKNITNVLLFLLTAGLATACSQEEMENNGNKFPEGQYPLTFTADLLAPVQSRATVDGAFSEGDQVVLTIDGENYTYGYVTSGGSLGWVATSQPAYSWRDDVDLAVTAYSYGGSTERKPGGISAADQSIVENYRNSDYIYATATFQFTNPNNMLTFSHQMAKIVVNVVNLTDASTIDAVSVGDGNIALDGTFSAPLEGNYGTWTVDAADQTSSVTPYEGGDPQTGYTARYEALVVPQTVNGNILKFDVPGYPSPFYYNDKSGSVTWKPGTEYTYNVGVTDKGLSVTLSESVGWGTGTSTGGRVPDFFGSAIDAGTGTADDPYEISTAYQFWNMASYWWAFEEYHKHFVITKDLDLTMYNGSYVDYDGDPMTWSPFGKKSSNGEEIFTGTIDGQGHTITGLKFESDTETAFGLFWKLGPTATIKNLTIKDCEIRINTASDIVHVGVLAYQNSGTIENCHVVGGTVYVAGAQAGSTIGGIAAIHTPSNGQCGNIVACSNSATLSGVTNVGGIVGMGADQGQLIACYNTGAISATDGQPGGICGVYSADANPNYVNACYFTNSGSNAYGTFVPEWAQSNIDAMNTALTGGGYTKYRYVLANGLPVVETIE